ncbi:MAG TPA: nucleotide exchange factor GrpE [Bacteroidia bacterium]|jgi:molecular chaperone GrpE|nr:nucleotide exchange factor GrpE [Bacteroidia bacterium]
MFKRKKMEENQKEETVNETAKPDQKNSGQLSGEPTDEKEKRINELEEQLSALNDKYLRIYSEFDNFRKRMAKEKIEILSMAGAEMIRNLLPVLDDLERAMANNEKATDVKMVNEGVNLVSQKFRSILNKNGLEAISAKGQPFDTEFHEAITNIPAPTPDLKGKVVEEIEKGYLLNGKVIRFAKVIVGS